MRGGIFGAAMKGNTEMVLLFLSEAENEQEHQYFSSTALVCAAWKGHFGTAEALI